MSENGIKFTDEELAKLKELQETYSRIISRFGELHFQQKLLEIEMSQLDEKYLELIDNRETIVTELQTKYGEGFVDINTGVFTPSKN